MTIEETVQESIATRTFNQIKVLLKGGKPNPLKLEFANLLTELGVLIPFAENPIEEGGASLIPFSKVQRIQQERATVVYPYDSSPEKTYFETL